MMVLAKLNIQPDAANPPKCLQELDSANKQSMLNNNNFQKATNIKPGAMNQPKCILELDSVNKQSMLNNNNFQKPTNIKPVAKNQPKCILELDSANKQLMFNHCNFQKPTIIQPSPSTMNPTKRIQELDSANKQLMFNHGNLQKPAIIQPSPSKMNPTKRIHEFDSANQQLMFNHRNIQKPTNMQPVAVNPPKHIKELDSANKQPMFNNINLQNPTNMQPAAVNPKREVTISNSITFGSSISDSRLSYFTAPRPRDIAIERILRDPEGTHSNEVPTVTSRVGYKPQLKKLVHNVNFPFNKENVDVPKRGWSVNTEHLKRTLTSSSKFRDSLKDADSDKNVDVSRENIVTQDLSPKIVPPPTIIQDPSPKLVEPPTVLKTTNNRNLATKSEDAISTERKIRSFVQPPKEDPPPVSTCISCTVMEMSRSTKDYKFVVLDNSKIQQLREIEKEMGSLYEEDEDYKVPHGYLQPGCYGVFIPEWEKWVRCHIRITIKPELDQFPARLIDYAVFKVVTRQNMRYMTDAIYDLPPQSYRAKLDPPCEEKLQQLEDFIMSQAMTFSVTDVVYHAPSEITILTLQVANSRKWDHLCSAASREN